MFRMQSDSILVHLAIFAIIGLAGVTCMETRIFPYGPLMCDRLCRHTVDCAYFFYAPHDLICHISNTWKALDGKTLKFHVSKGEVDTSTDNGQCSRNSRIHMTRSKKRICLKPDDRCKAVSSTYRYMGCYKDWESRILTDHMWTDNSSMTTNKCFNRCSRKRHQYLGTEVSFECFCGNTIRTSVIVPDKECSWSCRGDRSSKLNTICTFYH